MLNWKKNVQDNGIITGADANQEWMLPNWWRHYENTNTAPVTFIDFGMTKSARLWCEKRGTIIDNQVPFLTLAQKEDIHPITAKFWERIYSGNVWKARLAWFSKPLELTKTPYEKSIWVDIDCEIRKPLDDLFTYLDTDAGFAIAPTTKTFQKSSRIIGLHKLGETTYNSGVLAYKHRSPVMEKWALNSQFRNYEFMGDENALNRTIFEEKFNVYELPLQFNWPFFLEEDQDIKVMHYCTALGKQNLLQNA